MTTYKSQKHLYSSVSIHTLKINNDEEKTYTYILWLLSGISYVLRMLGPALGYALASVCLKMYISPTLTPTIGVKNPRWLGAWWLGKINSSILF